LFYEDNEIIDIIVIIHIRNYLSTAMDRTWQSTEFESWYVPYHQEVLCAHQSHFCLRVFAEDGGFQSDVSDIQTETEQICQAELREWGNCQVCQRFPDVFCGLLHQDHVDSHHQEQLLQEQKEHH
jgi:hypothetical protein